MGTSLASCCEAPTGVLVDTREPRASSPMPSGLWENQPYDEVINIESSDESVSTPASSARGPRTGPPKASALAPLSKEADDAEKDKKKLEELDAQLQKIETTRGAARTDALSEAVNKQAGTKLEKDDSVEEDIPESVKSESFEDESISGGASSKSVDLGGQTMEESSTNVFGRDESVDSNNQSLDHAESVEG